MTAMAIIGDARDGVTPGLPRFDDGMVNVGELARTLAESIVNEVMDVEADLECEGGNQRNGYRERSLLTSVGTITLRIPKLRRGSYFPEDVVERYSRTDRAIVAAVAEMVTCGVSTRKVERVAAKLGVDRLGKDAVSRMCATLDETVTDLQGRVFHDLRFPYLWLDATYIKAREGGHVSSVAVVTAIAAADDGHRYLVGVDAVDTESYASWLLFLRGLRDRGVTDTLCVTSDAHEGLRHAIEETFPGAAWQRCIVHLERNCCSLARTRHQRALVGQLLSAVFAERDPALVRELYTWRPTRSVPSAPRQASFWRMPRRTRSPTSTSPTSTTYASGRTTCRSAPTVRSSAGAASCRCSRRGGASSGTSVPPLPRWTRPGSPGAGSPQGPSRRPSSGRSRGDLHRHRPTRGRRPNTRLPSSGW